MLSVLEEESDIYEVFPPHVDTSEIPSQQDSPSSRKIPLKTYEEIDALLECGKKREVKIILRENCWSTHSTIRSQLWPRLCHQHAPDKSMQEGFYWDLVNQLFGTTELPEKGILLPQFVESQHKHYYHLTKAGIKVADRIVCVLGFALPDITYSPMVYPITALLLHFMTEEECYNCLASIVSSKDIMFITQTKQLHEVTWRTVMHISRKHIKSAAVSLSRHCPNSRSERIYMDWIWWVLQGLPFNHLVRVMDTYIHEGIKVFYRVSMAILVLFQKYTSDVNSRWSKEIQENGIDSALLSFCSQIPVSPRKLLRVAFGIRGLSSKYIRRVFVKTEMTLKSREVLNGSRQLLRSRSSENLPTSQSQINIQMMSHTLTIRERRESLRRCESVILCVNADTKGDHSPGPRVPSMGTYPICNIRSKILEQHDLFTLWSWLPMRITMYQPVLLYTTEEHGCSLTTFYIRVEQHEPTLLMIKTCNNEVFGAYCSSRWVERNQKDERGNRNAYFGTGETFLFSLYPERAKYPWVGMDDGKSVHHAAELFMAADTKMITIGGGDGQAIWMDENIRFGKTDRCLTFNNPPLCQGRDFEIRVLEVYGFGTA
ncbi:GTPase-activating protein skywalker isoform X2 [Halyomorpha halys]|uniref:GTPase-activating protein skywalker isoform X2 n=1 Tax=Halyomorpha halys TaxID=286706 RepID=UPI0006D4D10D|nr:TBC1 domain family member 24 isoform X3 [Halyomorpha halys]